jgi:hypothetical protein
MILVPLFDLKSLGSFRRLRCRDFKSAALAFVGIFEPARDGSRLDVRGRTGNSAGPAPEQVKGRRRRLRRRQPTMPIGYHFFNRVV